MPPKKPSLPPLTLHVDASLRDAISHELPGLGDNEAYWRFLQYLLFPSLVDMDSAQPVIPARTLAMLERKTHHRAYVGETFLDGFTRDVAPAFRCSGWSYLPSPPNDTKARVVLSDGLGDWANQARYSIVASYASGTGRDVEFVTGKKRSSAAKAKRREEVLAHVASLGPSGSQEIISYHNALPSNAYASAIRKHSGLAMLELQALEPPSPSRSQAIAQLMYLIEEPKLYLKPSPRSDRASSVYPSLQTIRRDVRARLTEGWVEYDLTAAQLAILASTWPVPEVQEALERTGNIWQRLMETIGLETEQERQGLKSAVYALTFGASAPRIRKIFEHEVGVAGAYKSFRRAPLVKAMWAARQRRLGEIMADGYVETYFGQVVSVTSRKEATSALALETQALEVALISSVYELAAVDERFTIMAYLYDGIIVRFNDKSRARAAEGAIFHALDERAEQLSVSTQLRRASLSPDSVVVELLSDCSRVASSTQFPYSAGLDPFGIKEGSLESLSRIPPCRR